MFNVYMDSLSFAACDKERHHEAFKYHRFKECVLTFADEDDDVLCQCDMRMMMMMMILIDDVDDDVILVVFAEVCRPLSRRILI